MGMEDRREMRQRKRRSEEETGDEEEEEMGEIRAAKFKAPL